MKKTFLNPKHLVKEVLLFFLSLFLFLSCSENERGKNVFIEGTFTGGNGQMLKLSEMTTEMIVDVDSTIVRNEFFRLSANISETSFFLLQFSDGIPITLVMSPGDSVQLNMDEPHRRSNYHLVGNHHSMLLKNYFNKTGILRMHVDSLRQALFESQYLPDFYQIKSSIDATLDSLLDEHQSFTRNLIELNPSSPAAILLINKSFAGKQFFNLDENLDLFQLTDTHLRQHYPENSHVELHHGRVMAALDRIGREMQLQERTQPGKAVPPIKLPNPEGKEIALNDLKGTTTLLFFWASWSPESRADIQLLKNLYQQNDVDGFEVFAISLDHREHFWKAALEVENTPWVNVHDASGMGGSLARLFYLPQKLPYYFVIDPQGIILLKTESFVEVRNHLQKRN